ncbi:hypothetical protein ABK040_014392 [Willaertia magna]
MSKQSFVRSTVDYTEFLAFPKKVVVHPLVLLSVVDHYNRIAKDTKNRVAGVLLGEITKDGVVDVTNSFAVPFEEDPKDSSIWFFDHSFLENMLGMFRKVTAKEKVVGWYSTGPKIRKSDIEIHQIIKEKYLPHPTYVIIDVNPQQQNVIPTDAYVAVEEREDQQSQPTLTFTHLPSEIGALEAEEIGVEHLLRDVKDTTISDLASSVSNRMTSLKALRTRLTEIHTYLGQVSDGNMPINHSILYLLQDVFNLLPGLHTNENQQSIVKKTNDTYLAMYLSSIIRCVVSLHDLINNKIELRETEKQTDTKLKKKDEEKKENETKDDEKKDSKKTQETSTDKK